MLHGSGRSRAGSTDLTCLQELLERQHEELSRVEAEIGEARAALDEHDAAVRQRAAELESASEKLAVEEDRLHAVRVMAEQEAAETKALASKAAESERAADQVLNLSMADGLEPTLPTSMSLCCVGRPCWRGESGCCGIPLCFTFTGV